MPPAATRKADAFESLLSAAPAAVAGNHEFLLRLGPRPVLFTAPHAVRHWRSGAWKGADRLTGFVALEAARRSRSDALVVMADTFEDANFEPGGVLKEMLSNVSLFGRIRALIDIHGMGSADGPDVILGTAGGRSPAALVSLVQNELIRVGLSVEVRHNGNKSAGRANTVTAHALRLGLPAIQLEIAPGPRLAALADESSFERLIEALVIIATTIGDAPGDLDVAVLAARPSDGEAKPNRARMRGTAR